MIEQYCLNMRQQLEESLKQQGKMHQHLNEWIMYKNYIYFEL